MDEVCYPQSCNHNSKARKYMAGSITKFIYQEDSPDGTTAGRQKLVNLDESTQRAIGEVPATIALAAAAGVSRTEKLSGRERYMVLQGATAAGIIVTRRVVVPSPINVFFLEGGAVILPVLVGTSNTSTESVTFRVTQSVGEVRKFALLTDTGLTDGTP